MRLVLDKSCVVAAMRSPTGASAAILRAVRRGRANLLMSVALALEYEAVCMRLEHRRAAGLTDKEALIFVDAVIAMAEPIETHYHWRPQLRDPSDEMVLEVAVNGGADAIVTFNVGDFGPVPVAFGIDVLVPGEALRRLS